MRVSDPSGTITTRDPAGERVALRTGALVRVVPNHSCVVSNLVDQVWLVDGDTVLERLPVAARGRIT